MRLDTISVDVTRSGDAFTISSPTLGTLRPSRAEIEALYARLGDLLDVTAASTPAPAPEPTTLREAFPPPAPEPALVNGERALLTHTLRLVGSLAAREADRIEGASE